MGASASFTDNRIKIRRFRPAASNLNNNMSTLSGKGKNGEEEKDHQESLQSPFRITTTEGLLRVAGVFFSCDRIFFESVSNEGKLKSRVENICIDLVHKGLLILLNADDNPKSDDALVLLNSLPQQKHMERELISNRLGVISGCPATVVVLTKSYRKYVQADDASFRNELQYLLNTKRSDQIVPVIAEELGVSKEEMCSLPGPLGDLMRKCGDSTIDFSFAISTKDNEVYERKLAELLRAIHAAMEISRASVKRSRSGHMLSQKANDALKAFGSAEEEEDMPSTANNTAFLLGKTKHENDHHELITTTISDFMSSASPSDGNGVFGTMTLPLNDPTARTPTDEVLLMHEDEEEGDEELRLMEEMLLSYPNDEECDDAGHHGHDDCGPMSGGNGVKKSGSTPRLSVFVDLKPFACDATTDLVVEKLVESLRLAAVSPDITELSSNAFLAIIEIVYGDQTKQVLLEQRQDFLGYFVNIFEHHLADPELCALAIRAAAVLCRCDQDAQFSSRGIIAYFGTNGMLSILMKAMTKHAAADKSVAEHGFRAIQVLCFASPGNQKKFLQKGACEVIVKCLTVHVFDAVVVEEACKCIRNFTLANPDNVAGLCQHGASAAIVHAMEVNKDYLRVAVQGCCALACLAGASSGSKKILHSLYEAGAHHAVIVALKAFPEHPQIAEWSMEVLAGLSLEKGNTSIEGLCAAGACEAVIEALRRHFLVAAVADFSCRALVHLSANPAHTTNIFMHHDAAGVVVNALTAHKTNESVITQACWAIVNVTIGDMEAKRRFVGAGVKSVLIAICREATVPKTARDWALEVLGEMY